MWLPKEETCLKLRREINLKRGHCTRYSLTQAELCYKNHMKRGKASLGNNTKSLCLLRSTVFLQESQTKHYTNMWCIKLLHDNNDDNAPAHRCKLMQVYLEDRDTETLPHPPYSPNFEPGDFFLFPHPKKCLAR